MEGHVKKSNVADFLVDFIARYMEKEGYIKKSEAARILNEFTEETKIHIENMQAANIKTVEDMGKVGTDTVNKLGHTINDIWVRKLDKFVVDVTQYMKTLKEETIK